MGGHTSPALTGPLEAGGRLIWGAGAVAPGKTFFRKSTKNSEMSTFGSKTKVVRTEILHILVPIPSRGDLYLTISRISMILSKLAKMVPSPRPYRSGLVVRSLAWDPKGARFDSWCMFKPRCFWGGAKAFSAAKIDLSQNKIGVPWIFMIFG